MTTFYGSDSSVRPDQDRMHTILDIPSLGPYFFHPPDLDSAISLRLYGSVPSATYRE